MAGRFLISLIKLYQISLSPLLGNRCRFYPSCSRYSTSCLEAYPLHVAFPKIIVRLCKCQPWHPGGIDYP